MDHRPLPWRRCHCVKQEDVTTTAAGNKVDVTTAACETHNASDTTRDLRAQLRLNALLFRGLMEFPIIAVSRAAQIRAGLWRRNGPGT